MTILRKAPSGTRPSPLSLLGFLLSSSEIGLFQGLQCTCATPEPPPREPGASKASLISGRVVRTRVEAGESTWVSLQGHKQLSSRIETHTRI